MIPAQFDYRRPTSVEEAIALLTEYGEDAKVLAGGHSLLPLMKLRLATPALLIDIGRIDGLVEISEEADHLLIGALARHHDLVNSPLVRERTAVLATVAGHIGDPQVRHRGTIGGSLIHGDPASDLPAAVLALDGELLVRGPSGERTIAAGEAFTGFLETALRPDELLVAVRVPKTSAGHAFQKFTRRAQDWAIVGVVVATVESVRIGLVNMGPVPLRAVASESVLANGGSVAEAADVADRDTEPTSDLGASAEFRRHLVKVLVRRALEEAGS